MQHTDPERQIMGLRGVSIFQTAGTWTRSDQYNLGSGRKLDSI